MNSNQFRKLVLDTPARKASATSPPNGSAQSSRNGATPSALGSRMRSSIPMTPRTVAGYSSSNDFARQLAERNSASSTQNPKKFRSSAAPKGAKLPEGYVDRAKQRYTGEEEEEGDKVKRVKALEEMMKLGQIDEETFIKLREEILGDEVGERAALVKGLDWKLLERVRRGEVGVTDVLEGKKMAEEEEDEQGEDVDDAFDELEEKEVEAVSREKVKKKGNMAPPELTGKKRNRDQILAEMKAARAAAKEAAKPTLGAKFKKVGERRSESRIEIDAKGREVLITVDEQGNEKRKVRKAQAPEPEKEKGAGLLMPDKDAKPLGMEVPDIPKVEEEEEDIDIFEDAGDDYDPLAGLGDDDTDEEEGEDGEIEDGEIEDGELPAEKKVKISDEEKSADTKSMPPPPRPAPITASRNYFGSSSSPPTESSSSQPPAFTDPTLLAALKKASSLNPIQKEAVTAEEKQKEEKRRKMLQMDDRDAQDMDMGFGSSRFEDEEDVEEKKVKLSEWGAGDDDGEGKGRGRGKGEGKERKRGPKKRKGDKNSVADVMGVLEGRKAK